MEMIDTTSTHIKQGAASIDHPVIQGPPQASESTTTTTSVFKKKILSSEGVFSNLLTMFNKRELIDKRIISDKFARDIPRQFKTLRYECVEDRHTGKISGFLKTVTRPDRLELMEIHGTEDNLIQLTEILKGITSSVKYLYLDFLNMDDAVLPSESLAR